MQIILRLFQAYHNRYISQYNHKTIRIVGKSHFVVETNGATKTAFLHLDVQVLGYSHSMEEIVCSMLFYVICSCVYNYQ